jgi:imidazolonepropionase-like amidohydrolase
LRTPASGIVPSILILLLTTIAWPGGAQVEAPAPAVIRAVRVFDGDRVLPAATVVLENRRITAVIQPGQPVDVPAGALEVDGTGRTLLPGFIDAHTHTMNRGQIKNALAFGVTTQLDMFTELPVMRALKAEQAGGAAADRPDLFSAGTLVTAPAGHGTQFGVPIPTLADADDAQRFVDARLAEGSDYIKIAMEDGSEFGMTVPTLDPEIVRRVIAAAHARDRLAVVHVSTVRNARLAIEAGADGLVHVSADRPPDADFGRLVADHHAFVMPTLTAIQNTTPTRQPNAIRDDPDLGPRLTPSNVGNLEIELPPMPSATVSMAHARAAVRLLHEAGAVILAGTDAPNPGTVHGASLHRELELLVDAGLSPIEALHAATAAAADAFHLPDRGRIAPGLRADVVLVAGDPTTDILDTRDVVGIWKEGRRYKLDLYLEEVARMRAALTAEPGGRPPAGAESGLISDFDEPDAAGQPPRARFGHGWETSTDVASGGHSTVTLTVIAGGAGATAGAMAIEGELVAGARVTFAGAMFRPGSTPASPVNLSAFDELTCKVRGDGGSYRLYIYGATTGAPVASRTFTAGPDWTEIELPFAGSDTDGRAVRGVMFAAVGKPRRFALVIDDLRLR